MKIVVEFELEEDLSHDDRRGLRLLFLDALYEFRAHRDPAGAYVASRYTWLNENQRRRKTGQVIHRNRAAKLLHRGLKAIRIQREEEV